MTLYDTFALRSSRRGVATDVPVVLAGSLLLVLSAKFQVPFFPVPMSMQTFVAIGLGLALGRFAVHSPSRFIWRRARLAFPFLPARRRGASGLPI
ncbi:MAG: hypothetical protein WBA42_19105 [Mesorhizobium sp.]